MTASSAVTINRSREEIMARLAEAEPPLSDDTAQISYASAPGNRGTEVLWSSIRAHRAVDWAKRWRRHSEQIRSVN